jgi:hypothetical protein
MSNKFTVDKYKIGISQEYTFLALMKLNDIFLDNLNEQCHWSSVDFKLQAKNIYIELKYRQIESNRYDTSVFDKKKVDRWLVDNVLSKSDIYIALVYSDNKYYFIKYDRDLFNSFDTQYLPSWDTTNYLIPLDKCIGLVEFVELIKQSTLS